MIPGQWQKVSQVGRYRVCTTQLLKLNDDFNFELTTTYETMVFNDHNGDSDAIPAAREISFDQDGARRDHERAVAMATEALLTFEERIA